MMNTTEKKLETLKNKLREIADIGSAVSVLYWDYATYMPVGGGEARGRQMALLGRLAQEKLIDPEIGRLLDELQPYGDGLPAEHDDAALLRLTRRQYEQAVKVPPDLIERFRRHTSQTNQAWAKARAENNFPHVEPFLEKTVDFSRQVAGCFPGYDHIADPLIDLVDYGMKAETIRNLFSDLRRALVPLVERITSQADVDGSCLLQRFPEEEQLLFVRKLAAQFGYDFQRGRLDKTLHPFMIKLATGDTRITTRVDENNFGENLFSVLHETGHALYEMGISPAYDGLPFNEGTSAGVHESQSRLWENIVGRSRPYWEYQYPYLQAAFPAQLGDVSLESYYRAINRVSRSLIRTEADEVTYNLHVMIRFDLELQMLEGSLAVKDLPEAWHARYEADLGVRAPNDVDGCLQDIHWYDGQVGGLFQGYTLGNIMSVQFFEAAAAAHPEITAEMAAGRYETLHTWLRENVYTHGSKFTTAELLERAAGGPLTIEPYVRYLRNKYGELYDLSDLDIAADETG